MVTLKALALATALTGAAGGQGSETVLLDFTAPWCGPCRSMRPVVDRLKADGYAVREVNIDQDRALASRFQVTSIPCFVVVVGGREVDRTVGATSYEHLRRMVDAGRAAAPPAHVPAQPRPVVPRAGLPLPPPARQPLAVTPGAASAAPARPPGTALRSSEAALLQSAVRIRIEDATGRSYGTGTLIDTRGDQALVLTCGHLFRDAKDSGKIFVELFLPTGVKTVPGHLVSYDLNRDVGMLSIQPGVPVRVARVAPKNHPIATGDRVANVGCNNGQPPTVRQTHVTAIDRYDGPPNIEAAGTPVEGRSGGGLFDQHGHVIGVCFAADAADNEGLYAGLASIHAELDRLGLADAYAPNASTSQSAATPLADIPPPLPRQMPRGGLTHTAATQPTSTPSGRPASGVQTAANEADSNTRLSDAEQAALAEIGRRSRGAEVICIVRPADPQAKSEVFILEKVTPEFIRRLTNPSSPGAAPAAPPRLTSLSLPPQANPRANVTVRRTYVDPNGWRPKPR